MAAVIARANTPAVSLTSFIGANRTLIQVVAAANHPIKIKSWRVTFNGTTSSAIPATVDLIIPSGTGTMSSGTAVQESGPAVTLQTAFSHTATAEPGVTSVLETQYVHTQSGYEAVYGLDDEIIIPAGGRFGIRVNSPVDVSARASIRFEE